ncbi:hypothetical protein BD410DRAFT_408391 [Rickenella mellea]|uniref:Uncharacterized protein n=1 Tax=Rickenella mellea TaxID=50990 RepID=A0A4Y7QHV8_9AGAM|nr:hypothetical protein BD410DRAFT_408391 [Rickenella mellea]
MSGHKRRLSLLPTRSNSTSLRPRRRNNSISLDGVHCDIILLILGYLHWPHDYCSLTLVCRTLHNHVMPELYKTITITPNTRNTLALLSKLDADNTICASVQSLIFDNVARSIRPSIPLPEEFDQARKKDLADSQLAQYEDHSCDPHRLRLRLHHVLPKLQNLHTVCLKRWNHILQGPLTAAECYNYWQSGPDKSTSLLRKLHITRPYPGPPPVMHGDREPCPLDIISLLLLRCEHIRKLYIVGTFPNMRFSKTPFAFDSLEVLVIGERTACANVWNGILRECKSLKVLGLLNVHFRFDKLFAGCHFPCLESIEWFGYAFSSANPRKPSRAFADFIEKHSETLKVVSLAPRTSQPRGFPFDGGFRIFNPDNELLPNLETLRLQNWTAFAADHDQWPHSESSQSRALVEEICRFVACRPKITDLTITDLPWDVAEWLTGEVLADRAMRRVLVGESLRASQAEHVPGDSARNPWVKRWQMPGAMLRREQEEWALTRKQQYLRDAWLSYELNFQGLALEECGYRPWLMTSKCPRSWVDYLRR